MTHGELRYGAERSPRALATLDDLPEETYQLFRQFLRLERDSGRLKALQSSFYGHG